MATRSGKLAAGRPRRRGWLVAVLLVPLTGWLTVTVVGDGGWLDLRQQRRQLAELEAEVARLAAVTDSLRTVLERLESDPAYLEKVAREDLGMVRPGESLYRLQGAGADSATGARGK